MIASHKGGRPLSPLDQQGHGGTRDKSEIHDEREVQRALVLRQYAHPVFHERIGGIDDQACQQPHADQESPCSRPKEPRRCAEQQAIGCFMRDMQSNFTLNFQPMTQPDKPLVIDQSIGSPKIP